MIAIWYSIERPTTAEIQQLARQGYDLVHDETISRLVTLGNNIRRKKDMREFVQLLRQIIIQHKAKAIYGTLPVPFLAYLREKTRICGYDIPALVGSVYCFSPYRVGKRKVTWYLIGYFPLTTTFCRTRTR